MKNMQKIGRSGVELHEVKRHVTLDDESATLPSKPKSNYQPRKVKGGIDHPRSFFPGIGEFVPESKRKPANLYPIELVTLIAIFEKRLDGLSIDNAVCKRLMKKDMIFWTSNHWSTTWKGDAAAKAVPEGKPVDLKSMKAFIKQRKRKLKAELK